MPRKHRPSFSVNAATRDRVAWFVDRMGAGPSRTAVVERAINEYLDASGVPSEVPSAAAEHPIRRRRPEQHVDDQPFYSGAGHVL